MFPSLDSLEAILWPAAGLLIFVITAVLVDVMILLAARWRLVDLPNRRSAHSLPTARGGGLAIVASSTLGAIAVAVRWPSMALPVLLGGLLPCLVIAAVGFVDDIRPLRASLRLLIQIAIAATITGVLGPIEAISIPGRAHLELGACSWPFTILWIVGMTNAFNFMDGSDGMAGLGAVVAGLCIGLLGLRLQAHLPLLLGGFVAAAAAGFLVFNWPPARIFMGDVGSGFLGTFPCRRTAAGLPADRALPVALRVRPIRLGPPPHREQEKPVRSTPRVSVSSPDPQWRVTFPNCDSLRTDGRPRRLGGHEHARGPDPAGNPSHHAAGHRGDGRGPHLGNRASLRESGSRARRKRSCPEAPLTSGPRILLPSDPAAWRPTAIPLAALDGAFGIFTALR
jgi:hypothetical protein